MHDAKEFSLDGETVRVDSAELERIKVAVLDRLARPATESGRANSAVLHRLRDELRQASVFVSPDGPQLGAWRLTTRDSKLALLRVRARGRMNVFFVAKLARGPHGGWAVNDFYQERMMAR